MSPADRPAPHVEGGEAWTPGPWRAVIRSNQLGPRSVSVTADKSVAGVWELRGPATLTAQNVADARLIAAAPDLYEACHEIDGLFDRVQGLSTADAYGEFERVCNVARAALLRARTGSDA